MIDSHKLIELIENSSSELLKNKFELSVLLEESREQDKVIVFKDLIFNAKYVNGLKKVLSGRNINSDRYMEKIFNEFNTGLQKVIDLLKIMAGGLDDKSQKHFNEKYFMPDHESISNVLALIEDLTKCKEYFNTDPDAFISTHQS